MPSSMPLLATKLYLPPARRTLIPRPRLTSRLGEGLAHPLTLISAPAGYGKTTLISEWRSSEAGRNFPLAWLSLDEGDNDTSRFLTYLIAALAALQPGLGESELAALGAPHPPPAAMILTGLINALNACAGPCALALDDYHQITARPVHEALTFLLDHLPPQLRLLLLTRADPPLPLPRLRARGQLTEIRAADLRFTTDETAAFLHQVSGRALTDEQVQALTRRTEGWPAGVQLAALCLAQPMQQDHEDVQAFIAAFAGSHHYIVDYLAEEVLSQQPQHLRDFLLKTAILDQFCGPLCDAVTGLSAGEAVLDELDRANLFLIPLDLERRWFRYHHLFADFLRIRLLHWPAAEIRELRGRAATWLEANGLPDLATDQALAAADYERAARLITQTWRSLRHRRSLLEGGHGYGTLLRWLDALPLAITENDPDLNLIKSRIYWSLGHIDKIEPCFQAVERALARRAPGQPPPGQQQTDVDSRLIEIRTVRAMIHSVRGEHQAALALARETLALAPADSLTARAMAHLGEYQAYRELGYLDEAAEACERVIVHAYEIASAPIVMDAFNGAGLMRQCQARLRRAEAIYVQALAYAEEHNYAWMPHVALAHIELGNVYHARNRPEAAQAHLDRGLQLSEQWGHHVIGLYGRINASTHQYTRGDAAAALATIREAERVAHQTGVLTIAEMLAAQLAWMEAETGDRARAQDWLNQQDLRIGERLGITRGACALLAGKVLLALGEIRTALDLLSDIERAAVTCGGAMWRIDALVLQAVAQQRLGQKKQALSFLGDALRLAEAEDYQGAFLTERAALIGLLQQAAVDGICPVFVRRLLPSTLPQAHAPLGEPVASRNPQTILVEPLSDRELEVLCLLAAGKSNQEIADALFLAVGTVKKHLNNIFGKLGVESRTQCVARARELKLL